MGYWLVSMHTHENFHSTASPEDQTTMTQIPTQSHYPDTELTSRYPVLEMSSASLGEDKSQPCMSLIWSGQVLMFQPPKWEVCALSSRTLRLMWLKNMEALTQSLVFRVNSNHSFANSRNLLLKLTGLIGRVVCGRLWVRTHGRVKPMTYKIDICHFLARCSALLG